MAGRPFIVMLLRHLEPIQPEVLSETTRYLD